MQEGTGDIVILGAGFAGVRTALDLARHQSQLNGRRIILIDRNSHHLFTPWLYERATTGSPTRGLKIPLADVIGQLPIDFIRGEVTKIDRRRREVHLQGGQRISFEYLVIALGSVSNDFDIPGIDRHAFTLKTYEDAEKIRIAVHEQYRTFLKRNQDGGLFQVLIGGGGFTGVELAGELHEYLVELANGFRDRDERFVVRILDADKRLLQGLHPWASMVAEQRLRGFRHLQIELQSKITKVHQATVELATGDTYEYEVLVWTGGVTPNPLSAVCEQTSSGRIKTRATLQLPDDDRIFAIGDTAGCRNPTTHRETAQTIYSAYTQGQAASRNIIRHSRRQPLVLYRANLPGYIVPINGDWALSTLGGYALTGWSAYWLHQLINLRYFLMILPFPQALRRWYRFE